MGSGGGATHPKMEGLNILRAYLSLVLGHGGGVWTSLDSSLAMRQVRVFFSVKC